MPTYLSGVAGEIRNKDCKRLEAGMINQAIVESLKTTTITQACTTVQNMDQPKPLSSLKDSLPHGEKDNSSSYVPQEVAGPAGSEDSDEDARLDELPHEELINNGMTFFI
ncbi:hypothetical protein FPRO03_13757 [Fusarium proliferatum]|nr:hypothetical protein FPRO03_13757 [Fusarium proliferatum]